MLAPKLAQTLEGLVREKTQVGDLTVQAQREGGTDAAMRVFRTERSRLALERVRDAQHLRDLARAPPRPWAMRPVSVCGVETTGVRS